MKNNTNLYLFNRSGRYPKVQNERSHGPLQTSEIHALNYCRWTQNALSHPIKSPGQIKVSYWKGKPWLIKRQVNMLKLISVSVTHQRLVKHTWQSLLLIMLYTMYGVKLWNTAFVVSVTIQLGLLADYSKNRS